MRKEGHRVIKSRCPFLLPHLKHGEHVSDPTTPSPLNERVARIEEKVDVLPQMMTLMQGMSSSMAVQAERWSVTDARLRKLEEERRCGEHVEVQVTENEAAIVEVKEAVAGLKVTVDGVAKGWENSRKTVKWVLTAALGAGLGGTAIGDVILKALE